MALGLASLPVKIPVRVPPLALLGLCGAKAPAKKGYPRPFAYSFLSKPFDSVFFWRRKGRLSIFSSSTEAKSPVALRLGRGVLWKSRKTVEGQVFRELRVLG